MAIDGCSLNMPDETANAKHFGYPVGAPRDDSPNRAYSLRQAPNCSLFCRDLNGITPASLGRIKRPVRTRQ